MGIKKKTGGNRVGRPALPESEKMVVRPVRFPQSMIDAVGSSGFSRKVRDALVKVHKIKKPKIEVLDHDE